MNYIIKPWFFGINENGLNRYFDMIKVAVKSKQKTNPSITAYCIYDGNNNDCTKWLEDNDVNVIHHSVSFSDVLKTKHVDVDLSVALGAYLRIEIPVIIEKYNIECKNYLYTDCDIMMVGDLSPLFDVELKSIAVAPEFDQNNYHYFNSGVMLANTSKMIEDYPILVQYIKDNIQNFNVYDQSALNEFYPISERQKLNSRYNWKGYWGHDDSIKIIHFHGPKPNQYPPYSQTNEVCPTIHHLTEGAYPDFCKQWFEILNN